MSRQSAPSSIDSTPPAKSKRRGEIADLFPPEPTNPWTAPVTLGVLIAAAVLALAGIFAVGYYLPAVGAKTYWFISRSSGIVAYVLITLGMLWGLVQSGSLMRTYIPPLVAFGMHNFLSWLGMGFVALHALILVGDGYINIDLPRVFTPFLAEYRPIPVGLGIVSFYLMLLLTLSFYARSHLGQRTFRLLHYASFGVFVMVTAHGLWAGSDSGALLWLYILSTTAVVLVTLARVINTSGRQRGKPQKRATSTGSRAAAPRRTAKLETSAR